METPTEQVIEALRAADRWLDGWCPTATCCAESGKAVHEQIAAALKAWGEAHPTPPPAALAPEEVVWRIEVFREDDGRFAAEFRSADNRVGGMGEYAATPVGALANLCATLIHVAEDEAAERLAAPPPARAEAPEGARTPSLCSESASYGRTRLMETPTERATCELCGEAMPPGEEMFKFHGYSGPCPKPPLPAKRDDRDDDIPADVRRDLMACATSNGRISYYYLCDVWRRGRTSVAGEAHPTPPPAALAPQEIFIRGWGAGFTAIPSTPDGINEQRTRDWQVFERNFLAAPPPARAEAPEGAQCDLCRHEAVREPNRAEICGWHYQRLVQRLAETEADADDCSVCGCPLVCVACEVREDEEWSRRGLLSRHAEAERDQEADRLRAEVSRLTQALEQAQRGTMRPALYTRHPDGFRSIDGATFVPCGSSDE